jgi:putative chitinase
VATTLADPVAQIDLPLLKIAFPSNKGGDLIQWAEPLKAACRQWGINTIREVASFLGNIAVESRDLQALSESLNYSPEGLMKTFSRARISEADCRRLGRQAGEKSVPEARQIEIANILYGGEFGRKNLGNTQAGDGWLFRGCCPIQLTGRANFQKCADALRMRVEDLPVYVRTRLGGAMAAGWFWKAHDMDAVAATPGWADDRKKINGGHLGLDVLNDRASAIVTELLKRGC